MALPVLLLILHGPIATNILNFYSCGLAALSFGLKVARWKVSLPRACSPRPCSSPSSRPATSRKSFDAWMVSLIVWISPWAAIVLVEFFVVQRGRVDVARLYERETRSRIRRRQLAGAARARRRPGGRLVVAVRPGRRSSRGRWRRAFSNTDLSWLTGAVVAGLGSTTCSSAAASGSRPNSRRSRSPRPPSRSSRADDRRPPLEHLGPRDGLAARRRRGRLDLLRRRRREPGARARRALRRRTCRRCRTRPTGRASACRGILELLARTRAARDVLLPGPTAALAGHVSRRARRPATRSACHSHRHRPLVELSEAEQEEDFHARPGGAAAAWARARRATAPDVAADGVHARAGRARRACATTPR